MENNYTSSDTQPQPEYTSQPPVVTQPKKRGLGAFWVVIIVIVVALVAGAGAVLGYKAWFEKDTTSTTSTTTTQPSKASDTDAATLITGLKPQLKSSAVATEATSDGSGVVVKGTNYGVDGAPTQRPDGYDFFTSPDSYSSAVVASKSGDTLSGDLETTRNYFNKKGLQLDSVNFGVSDDTGSVDHYHNATTVCSVSQSTYSWPQGNNQLTINCADSSSYGTEAAKLKPLYDAMLAARQKKDTMVGEFFGGASFTDSKTPQYHLASVGSGSVYSLVGGAAVQFYQTPDGTWHYFTTTQSVLSCEQYKTSDLKKAYLGTTCYTADDQESKVTE